MEFPIRFLKGSNFLPARVQSGFNRQIENLTRINIDIVIDEIIKNDVDEGQMIIFSYFL